jgi:hypothetical protein
MTQEQMRFQAAAMAMQGLSSNYQWGVNRMKSLKPDENLEAAIAGDSIELADALLSTLYPSNEKSLPTDTDGWIAHRPGDPMPCDHDLMVCVRFIDGEEDEGDHDAGFWNGVDGSVSFWDENGFETIIAWKPSKKS